MTGLGALLEEMTPQQCRECLAAASVGRVDYMAPRGPVAVPVNYRLSGLQVIMSTDVTKAAELEAQRKVGFEIDRIDDAELEGWSVLVSGPARRVDDPEELVDHARLGLEVWAGGLRQALVALDIVELTGRRILHDDPCRTRSRTD